ncbi:REP-associated tyrosine transposase [Gracilimonas mengyeensis]|uniref:REP element-mobilizing transposase RayT n=1 Tax=Gracilimonas mengyeensis TaxID=1302730 RepID=A0A521F581_9BACT|nr:transposase [Gracilimonas mengyeensis]SMO91314.1 REP element-mobilizing transposase RayT [Gracilimonas mengyeensis]
MAGFKIHNHQQAHFITFAVIDWIDVFSRLKYKKFITDSLIFCQKNKGLKIHGWCLMTNHMHLLISAKQGYDLSAILRDFKKYTASSILNDLETNPEESHRKWMLWMFKRKGRLNPNNINYQFWQQDNRPMEVVSNKFFTQKMNYIHYNPVKEGFCKKPQDYPYSSAQWYIDKTGIIRIDEILI